MNKKKIVTYAQPGFSAHNYGAASDWTVFRDDKPIWPLQFDSCWETYKAACEEAGARWGGSFRGLTDYFHNELMLSVTWSEVLEVYREKGQEAANSFISINTIVPLPKAQPPSPGGT